MTITINNKEYTITRDADWEYRSSRVNPDAWVAMYLEDKSDKDEYGDTHKYIAWYYVEDNTTELEAIDYESPYDLEDIGY